MALSADDIDKLARLSRLTLGDDEKAALKGDLEAILGYVEQLSEVDTEGVEPMTHAVPTDLRRREDAPIDVVGRAAVAGSAGYEDGLVRVPHILKKKSES